MDDYGERFAAAIAAELRAQKARRRIGDEDIADAVGVHRVSVSRYLSGARPIPMVTFAELCDYLGVSPVEVIDNAEKQARRNSEDS
ncbi:helix-turn-helix domain-containing protein [Bifidobacterium tissieri]|uniref:XRE family transcriptional regulator n=1 Tax=Bifidobacterium tissieri TaxID=1630162 RepID=A0A5M9ZU02_9BIFI|nr:helix-turn-helix transcriptional regulator [Bifidobacterium tissieri]KAA8830117.1 XRE family transcriptional regulator [Bifidobacterium tissieri]KAA8830939.1 XRE family transcriptional regulator [Bifidobacterium tissieri]